MTGSRSFLSGIHDPTAATIHPGKLVRGIRRVALSRGVRVFENSPMIRLERRERPVVRTAQGIGDRRPRGPDHERLVAAAFPNCGRPSWSSPATMR